MIINLIFSLFLGNISFKLSLFKRESSCSSISEFKLKLFNRNLLLKFSKNLLFELNSNVVMFKSVKKVLKSNSKFLLSNFKLLFSISPFISNSFLIFFKFKFLEKKFKLLNEILSL